jgi:hypothetical protein
MLCLSYFIQTNLVVLIAHLPLISTVIRYYFILVVPLLSEIIISHSACHIKGMCLSVCLYLLLCRVYWLFLWIEFLPVLSILMFSIYSLIPWKLCIASHTLLKDVNEILPHFLHFPSGFHEVRWERMPNDCGFSWKSVQRKPRATLLRGVHVFLSMLSTFGVRFGRVWV